MKKKRIIILFTVVVALAVVILFFLKMFNHNTCNLKTSGTLIENLSEFSVDISNNEPDEITEAYLENITYEIIDIDTEKMIATLNVEIPNISNVLSTTLDKVITENIKADYDELKEIAKTELSNVMKSNELEKETTQIQLSIEQIDGTYKLIPNEEWNELILGKLENLYMEYLKVLIGGMTNETPQ